MTMYAKDVDPFYSARMQIHHQVITGFFAAEETFKVRTVDRMVEKNNKALDWPTAPNMFQFRTTVYRHSSLNSFQRGSKFPKGIPVIHASLEEEMIKLAAQWGRVETDKQKLKQLLSIVLKPCVNFNQVRNALPEMMIRHVPGLNQFKRTEPFELESRLSPAQWQDYNNMLPRLHIYNGSALLC